MHNKAFKSDSQRLAVSLRSSVAKRRSHLNAALCLITQNQLFVLLFVHLAFKFSLVGKLTSVVAVFWTPIRGRKKFRELPH